MPDHHEADRPSPDQSSPDQTSPVQPNPVQASPDQRQVPRQGSPKLDAIGDNVRAEPTTVDGPLAWRGLVGRVNWNELWATLAALVLALLVGAVLMVVADPAVSTKWSYFFARPGDALTASWDKIRGAYGALFEGSVGSWGAITNTTAQAAPLICGGLAVGLAFRAGLFNIGAAGQAVLGAIAAAWIGFSWHLPLIIHLPVAVLGGIIGGTVWSGLAGLLKARFGAHEVIVTIMLNYVSYQLLQWLLTKSAFLRPGQVDPMSPAVDWSATFPRLAGTQLHLGFFLSLAAAFVVWWLLERTPLGFQIKAVGSNPSASATAGMSVSRVTIATMAISGALAGLIGVNIVLAPIAGAIPTPLTNGIVGTAGFDAITVALLGRSKPGGIVAAGLLWGAMTSGGLLMQSQAQTPSTLTVVLQALVVMFVAAPMLVRALLPWLKARRASSDQIIAAATTSAGAAS